MTGGGQFIEVQGTGEEATFSRGQLDRLLKLGKHGVDGITAAQRKAVDRDRYERDLAMQERVRETYMTLAHASNWIIFDGERSKELIAEDVFRSVTSRLGPL